MIKHLIVLACLGWCLLPAGAAEKKGAPPASFATASRPHVPVIEYYGDSTIWGYATGRGTQVAVPAPAAFADALPAKYIVKNLGVSGTSACQLLNGTDGVHPVWEQQMAASDARYVIINHAINDLWREDLSSYQSCLRKLARTAKRSGKQVIFETPNPIGADGDLASFVRAMKEIAHQEKIPVIDQYRYLNDYLQSRSPYTICPDGLHPTDAVYVMKGRYAARVFMRIFPAR